MGMAASQARWLALTARKTNVEYEGQQVNQARTALAMKSANTFNELLALEVPTAPSSQDFTKLEYTYQDGTVAETIDDMTLLENDSNFNYIVTHHHYADIYTGIQNKLINPQVMMGENAVKDYEKATVRRTGDTYTINGKSVQKFEYVAGSDSAKAYDILIGNYPELGKLTDSLVTYNKGGQVKFSTLADLDSAAGNGNLANYYIKSDIPKYVGNSILQSYDPYDTTDKAAYDQICADNPEGAFSKAKTSDIYKWVFQGQTRYACLDDLKKSYNTAPNKSTPTENQDKLTYYIAEALNTRIERKEKAIVDINEEGRVQSIMYEDSNAKYAISTATKTDDAAYQDAMNQYHYNMEVYEKKVADINAKTEKIQEQDRTLELRLRQLDTEQKALSQEMEAVSKVIQKNIDSTFKTFES